MGIDWAYEFQDWTGPDAQIFRTEVRRPRRKTSGFRTVWILKIECRIQSQNFFQLLQAMFAMYGFHLENVCFQKNLI